MHECSCSEGNIYDFICEVVSSEALTNKMTWLTVKCPELARRARPGNCVMVFPSLGLDPILGRPFAVADVDPEKGELSVCYALVGRGTKMLDEAKRGDKLRVRGLFGTHLPVGEKKIHLASGGVGVAIFLLYNKIYRDKVAGFYLGVPGKGYERCAEKISALAPNAKIFCDDGAFGAGDSMFKILPKELGENEEIWTCGPLGFFKAAQRHFAAQPEKLFFSLENRMACGYGGCMGCVVETANGLKRVCVDQSLFRSDEVSLDD
ncbi:hypothetical protein LJC40_05085 [Synergistaceae bacterium OttesenSCG-928-D05]|nr:hypothetical protein [Synergistaceae bacterium OttesenSCG-928-D05]